MERLTEREKIGKCLGIWVKEGFAYRGLRTWFNGCDEGYLAINKLAEYEDLEEQCIKENTWGLKILLKKWKEFFEDIQELYEYRNLKKQGKLLKLSCAVGCKIWSITSPEDYSSGEYKENLLVHPQEKKVVSITISKNGILYHVKDRAFASWEFGKTIFLTKEEAEQALKGQEGGMSNDK